ncbi:MAG: penicillin-binding protein 2 [Holosporales bacterium]|nr:penicillin-binding protein 2 [Holosporales bacterium]
MSKYLNVWDESIRFDKFYSLTNWRLLIVSIAFSCFFFLICIRLTDVMIFGPRKSYNINSLNSPFEQSIPRADIVDRNGNILATHLITASVYADTDDIQNPKQAAELLHSVLEECLVSELEKKLSSGKRFIWLARHLTPKKQDAIRHLGIPGIYFKKDYKRVYPYSRLASHIIGFCDIDGYGIAGVEKSFEKFLRQSNEALRLSIDIRAQHILMKMLSEAIKEFSAIGGNAIFLKVKTGEIIAMESLPNIDLNHPSEFNEKNFFNINTLGVIEPGSVLKVLNVAIGLETGKITMNSVFDATKPIKIGKFVVSDFKGKDKILTLRESFIYSSNIASIKMLQAFGGAIQKKFFEDFGLFDPISLEISEIGHPIFPKRWTEATAMSCSYGYGIAVSPLRILATVNGIINDGIFIEPTIIYNKKCNYRKIILKRTSRIIRDLMRDAIIDGTGRRANIKGYRVFGKTGTTYKNKKGGYLNDANRARITSCIIGFPFEDPEYILLFMLDEPKSTEKTFGYATAGWNVAPYSGKTIEMLAPILGISFSNEA